VRIRDFQVREVFSASQAPPGHNLALDPRGGIWMETLKGDIVLFRNGILDTKIPLNKGGSPLNRQIIAEGDGSLLVGSENGLVGWRTGKVQRMTTENGLPCDFVITLIKDKEKRWWLYTRCGVVELSDSELQRCSGTLWGARMHERAALMKGELVVWSEVDAGTEVELRVSVSAAYMTDRKPSWWLRKFAPKA
jgi:ligand-binding sensor domain-containing protein